MNIHKLWPVSRSKKKKKPVLWGHSSCQCESCECASLRIRPFRITRPQISASIPSETDYPGLSQTQRIITGSPLGHCSLHAPWMEIHCWARCQRWLGGNTGYSLTLPCITTDRQTIFLSLCFLFLYSVFFLYFTPTVSSLFHSLSSISDLPLYLSQTCSHSVTLYTPFSLSGDPILHIAPISLIYPPICFMSPVSAALHLYISP